MATDMRLRIQQVKHSKAAQEAKERTTQKPKPADSLKDQVAEAKRRFQE